MSEIYLRDDVVADYNTYVMGKGEFFLNFLVAFAAAWFVLYLFYGYWFVGILALPVGLVFPRLRTRSLIKKRKGKLVEQFKEMLYALSASMQAGKSIESAFLDCYSDLELQFPDPGIEIMCELRNIIANLNAGEQLDAVLADFARRTQEEEIETFVDVYVTSKEKGGDIVRVMKTTSDTISEKIDVRRDIEVSIASAKFEQKVLTFVPIGVILMIRFIMPGYLEDMYGTVPGILLSTVALVMFCVAVRVGGRITDIKV